MKDLSELQLNKLNLPSKWEQLKETWKTIPVLIPLILKFQQFRWKEANIASLVWKQKKGRKTLKLGGEPEVPDKVHFLHGSVFFRLLVGGREIQREFFPNITRLFWHDILTRNSIALSPPMFFCWIRSLSYSLLWTSFVMFLKLNQKDHLSIWFSSPLKISHSVTIYFNWFMGFIVCKWIVIVILIISL